MMRAARLAVWLVSGVTALPALAQEITSARYADPTTRYAHGVLGDAVEWGALVLELSDGTRRRLTLPETLVFEDAAPRLGDLDGDGAPEVIVVESSLSQGARLAIYGPFGRLAATPHIGRSHLWLAPIGAADLDGDGRIEIAYIDRPHMAKTLRIWRYEPGKLVEVASKPGLSNHKIGWDFIAGGMRHCDDGPEMIT
ncbi:MAG: VCBS repeat-containing protein, partial [Roseovarius sp.]|nr:VCBS repeat-containing protein [Roseovarius sp.]